MNQVFRAAQYTILFMVAIIIFVVGPRIEPILFPVVTKFEIPAEGIHRMPDGSTQISGVLIKARGECEPVKGSLTVFTDEFTNSSDHPAKPVLVSFEPKVEWYTRPAGSQYFGPWTLTPPGPPLGPSLIIRIRHRCHPFWETETTLYTGLTSDFFTEAEITGKAPWEIGDRRDRD